MWISRHSCLLAQVAHINWHVPFLSMLLSNHMSLDMQTQMQMKTIGVRFELRRLLISIFASILQILKVYVLFFNFSILLFLLCVFFVGLRDIFSSFTITSKAHIISTIFICSQEKQDNELKGDTYILDKQVLQLMYQLCQQLMRNMRNWKGSN